MPECRYLDDGFPRGCTDGCQYCIPHGEREWYCSVCDVGCWPDAGYPCLGRTQQERMRKLAAEAKAERLKRETDRQNRAVQRAQGRKMSFKYWFGRIEY